MEELILNVINAGGQSSGYISLVAILIYYFVDKRYKNKLENNHFATVNKSIDDILKKLDGLGNSLDEDREKNDTYHLEMSNKMTGLERDFANLKERFIRCENKLYNGNGNGK